MDHKVVLDVQSDKSKLTEQDVEEIRSAINLYWAQPKFKAEHFVGNSQIHPYAKYKQFLLELKSREEVCESMEYHLKITRLEMEIAEEQMQSLEGIERKRAELEFTKAKKDFRMSERRMEDAYRERRQYLELIRDFKNSKQNILPDGRVISELVGDEDFEQEMEKQYWTVRLAKQVALDYAQYGRPGAGNMDSILMLSGEQQNEVLGLASDLFTRVEARNNMFLSDATKRMQLGHTEKELAKLADININKSVNLLQRLEEN